MTIDDTKDPNLTEKVKYCTYTLDRNLSDLKYIYHESDFEGFIMDNYLPHQRYDVKSNTKEEMNALNSMT